MRVQVPPNPFFIKLLFIIYYYSVLFPVNILLKLFLYLQMVNDQFLNLAFSSDLALIFFFLPELFLTLVILFFFIFSLLISGFSLPLYYRVGVSHLNALVRLFYLPLGISLVLLFNVAIFYFENIQVLSLRDGVFLGSFSQFFLSFWTVIFKFFLVVSFLVYLIFFFPISDSDGFWKIEFFFILTFSFLGLLGLFFVADFCLLFLSLELATYCLFMLSASGPRGNIFGVEASLKYFILSTVSSAFFLFGLSFIYLTTGSLSFQDLRLFLFFLELDTTGLTNIISLNFSIFLVLSSILLKVGAAPFHVWVPDVYAGSPLLVTGYFATVVKVGYLGVLARLYWELMDLTFLDDFSLLLFIAGILSVFIGSLGAFFQVRLKRWFAYSSIVHIGFLIVTIPLSNSLAIPVFFFYLFSYLILAFSLLVLMNSRSLVRLGSKIQTVYDLRYLLFSSSEFTFLIIFTLFSFAGIPPFIGFFAKVLVFYILAVSYEYVVVLSLLILSVLSAYYYLRLIKFIFFDFEKSDIFVRLRPARAYKTYILVFFAFINFFSFFYVFSFWVFFV